MKGYLRTRIVSLDCHGFYGNIASLLHPSTGGGLAGNDMYYEWFRNDLA